MALKQAVRACCCPGGEQGVPAEMSPRFHDRPGGYTRLIKRHERRLGDGGRTAFLELLKEGETKVRARAPSLPPAPAPRVREPETSTPETTPPPAAENSSEP
jgi:large subunit ribosomal protein L17